MTCSNIPPVDFDTDCSNDLCETTSPKDLYVSFFFNQSFNRIRVADIRSFWNEDDKTHILLKGNLELSFEYDPNIWKQLKKLRNKDGLVR